MSSSVVNRLWARYLETGNYNRRPGQGRPRATTDRQERYLRNLVLRNRHSTGRCLRNDFQLATGVRVSNQRVRNRLHGDSLHARCPATGPILTVAHQGAQWLSGRVLASRPKGRGFEPHRRHCVVVLEQDTFILA